MSWLDDAFYCFLSRKKPDDMGDAPVRRGDGPLGNSYAGHESWGSGGASSDGGASGAGGGGGGGGHGHSSRTGEGEHTVVLTDDDEFEPGGSLDTSRVPGAREGEDDQPGGSSSTARGGGGTSSSNHGSRELRRADSFTSVATDMSESKRPFLKPALARGQSRSKLFGLHVKFSGLDEYLGSKKNRNGRRGSADSSSSSSSDEEDYRLARELANSRKNASRQQQQQQQQHHHQQVSQRRPTPAYLPSYDEAKAKRARAEQELAAQRAAEEAAAAEAAARAAEEAAAAEAAAAAAAAAALQAAEEKKSKKGSRKKKKKKSSKGLILQPRTDGLKLEDKYEVTGVELGRGATGVVKLGVALSNEREVAIKILPKASKLMTSQDFQDEFGILGRVKHKHLTRMLDAFETSTHLYMVMELSEGGELFDRLIEHKRFPEKYVRTVAAQLFDAINHLHSLGITHRDLKPENILFKTNAMDSPISVTDFGFAKHLFEKAASGHARAKKGTMGYAAPEIFTQARYDEKVDIWSAGIILYIMISGTPPFCGHIDYERAQHTPFWRWANKMPKVPKSPVVFQKEFWRDVSDSAKDFIGLCLTIDPQRRPRAMDLLQHSWIKSLSSKGNKSTIENLPLGLPAYLKQAAGAGKGNAFITLR